MLAVAAVIAFAVALILHLIPGGGASLVVTFELIGFICLAGHLVWPYQPWHRTAP